MSDEDEFGAFGGRVFDARRAFYQPGRGNQAATPGWVPQDGSFAWVTWGGRVEFTTPADLTATKEVCRIECPTPGTIALVSRAFSEVFGVLPGAEQVDLRITLGLGKVSMPIDVRFPKVAGAAQQQVFETMPARIFIVEARLSGVLVGSLPVVVEAVVAPLNNWFRP